MGVRPLGLLVEQLRGLRFAPLWVIVLVAYAALWGFAAAVGFGYFAVLLAAISTPTFPIAIATERRRYGGREQMREFYDVIRARQLPVLTSADEAIRWNRLIIDERTNRRSGLALSWVIVGVASFVLGLPVLFGLADGGKGYEGSGFGMLVAGILAIAAFAWLRFANPRVLAALDVLAQQGTERGYGSLLTAGWSSAR
ncbi:hypothetical protein [Nocardia niigatensis]|uniref:hypothetical protein n=1 Tax=Nocardia niigatensis TaxID=209249 RepID=UPI0005945CB7|nr:hypothetical protein [Nocardia niigatensis]